MFKKIRSYFSKEGYGYNAQYLTKDGRPYFPIIGEMHYARTNENTWREEMVKMKSCGIDTVSTYIFWIYHEPEEGQYNFKGNFNIRKFIKTAEEVGLKVWIRIGPFVHAELRNGGYPDWMIEKCSNIRTNDESYLSEITKYFRRLYEELEGLFYKDGGPITGIQLENEFGHVGGGTRPENEAHLKVLKKIINDIGYDAPYYTATGWGCATVGDCLPVMGGYCETPWARRSEKIEPSKNYVITYERDDHMVGYGNEIGSEDSFNYDELPFLTAELGGGLIATYWRRPLLKAEDIGAVSLVKLASGCNCLGYYMFHGGIFPKGETYPFNETRETGGWCDLPEFDYNFFAPIGSYNEFNGTYKELKLLFMFLKDFGEDFCSMKAEIKHKVDEEGKIYESEDFHPNNLENIRYSVRHNGKSGYLFVNNYVKGYEMKEHKDVKFSDLIGDHIKNVSPFSSFDINDGDYFFYPVNMKVGDLKINTASATPLCILRDKKGFEDHIFLYGGNDEAEVIYGKKTKINILSKGEALNANKITLDRDYLFITDGHVIVDGDEIILYKLHDEKSAILVYPRNDSLNLKGYEVENSNTSDYSIYKSKEPNDKDLVEITDVSQVSEDIRNANYYDSKDVKAIDMRIRIDYPEHECDDAPDDIYLNITYRGDMLQIIVNDEIVNDNFNNNAPFTVGLKEYNYPTEIVVRIYGIDEDSYVYFEKAPEYEEGFACGLSEIETKTRYKTVILEKSSQN